MCRGRQGDGVGAFDLELGQTWTGLGCCFGPSVL